MKQDASKHFAQEIVDKVFFELQQYGENSEKTMNPKEREKLERRRKQLLKELAIVLAHSKNVDAMQTKHKRS